MMKNMVSVSVEMDIIKIIMDIVNRLFFLLLYVVQAYILIRIEDAYNVQKAVKLVIVNYNVQVVL